MNPGHRKMFYPRHPKVCAHCGGEFLAKYKSARYCYDLCCMARRRTKARRERGRSDD